MIPSTLCAAHRYDWTLLYCPPTFEVERLVPPGVEGAPLDLGLQAVLLVRQQRHPHVRVRQPVGVLGSQVLGLLGEAGVTDSKMG